MNKIKIKKMMKLSKELKIDFIPCESSNIEAYGCDFVKKTIWILFKKNKLYSYKVGNAYQLFEDLKAAESKGKWVNENLVKPKVPYSSYEVKFHLVEEPVREPI